MAYLGVDRKRAIDADVLHMQRLGLDAYRIHVWDREVSDREGNLVENDHLDLLDYLMAKLAEHEIKALLTPIAWWPAGYPERDPGSDGFSEGYDKPEMSVDLDARRAQANYLRQFINHRNPYTGLTYAEDPNLIAIEIFNEPRHPAGPDETTRYIDAMASALRDAGLRKPIFYNISENFTDEHGHAVCSAEIEGVSHQWYPTGLVRNGAVGGNMLPNVDRYTIPYADFPECGDKARMVYEFDAADVGGSYMYPAMARAFRGAGFQWATQFAYDPLAMAYANTEYQTHYLNLVYTPKKAISFLIAGEVFRRTPRGASYGTYPESERFGPFRVSFEEDRSEMVTDTEFFYSNGSDAVPPSPASLERVAGVGSSSIVKYDGSGAYFLDKLADGVWRLELYPDVAWVHDPFTRPSLDREASRVIWRERPIRITLPDLGDDLAARPIGDTESYWPTARGTTLDVRPGVYLVTRSRTGGRSWTADTVIEGRRLGAFVAPPPSDAPLAVLHEPPSELSAGAEFTVRAEVVSQLQVDSAVAFVRRVGEWGRPPRVSMDPVGAFGYEARVPAEFVREGLIEYTISVYKDETVRTFPGPEGGEPGHPFQWDFTGSERWRVPIVAADAPVLLFDGQRDLDHVLYPHPWSYVPFRTDLAPGSEPGRLAVRARVSSLSPSPHHFALRTFLPEAQRGRLDVVPEGGVLRIRARAADLPSDRMEVALVQRDGSAWGTVLHLTDEWKDFEVPVDEFRRVPLALLPRPYPQFLPYLVELAVGRSEPALVDIDGLQFSVSETLFDGNDAEGAHGFEIERVVFEAPR